MAQKFNDPDDPCKYMVATDAIGMGLNLNIRRVIFYAMSKLTLLENGDKEMTTLSVSQALQIAGRAGRYNTKWETGYVTTFNQADVSLKKIMHTIQIGTYERTQFVFSIDTNHEEFTCTNSRRHSPCRFAPYL